MLDLCEVSTFFGPKLVCSGDFLATPLSRPGLLRGVFHGTLSPAHHKQIPAIWLTKTIFMIRLVEDLTRIRQDFNDMGTMLLPLEKIISGYFKTTEAALEM